MQNLTTAFTESGFNGIVSRLVDEFGPENGVDARAVCWGLRENYATRANGTPVPGFILEKIYKTARQSLTFRYEKKHKNNIEKLLKEFNEFPKCEMQYIYTRQAENLLCLPCLERSLPETAYNHTRAVLKAREEFQRYKMEHGSN